MHVLKSSPLPAMDKFDVLDKGYIQLIDMMPSLTAWMSPEDAVVSAARTSHMGHTKGADKDKALLKYMIKNKHTSPFEMVEFKFSVYAPLVVWWQWTRHRTWNYNAQSGRYTQFQEESFYVPQEWRKQHKSNKQMSDGKLDTLKAAILSNDMYDIIESSYRLYDKALSFGVAREQARLFLPAFSCYYKFICKVNAKNLIDFLKLRAAEEAQHEIREYALIIRDEILKPLMPITWEEVWG